MIGSKTIAALVMVAVFSIPMPVMAADWMIDSAHSTLAFSGKQTGRPFSGHFGSFAGTISFDSANPEAGQAHVTIAMSSAVTGDKQRDGALLGHDWFDIGQFPSAVFDAQSFRAKSSDTYEAIGTLTIKGVSKPVTLPFTLSIKGSTLHVKGHLDLLRSAFGVGRGPWSTGQWVALEVAVDSDVTAQRKP